MGISEGRQAAEKSTLKWNTAAQGSIFYSRIDNQQGSRELHFIT